MLSLEDLNVSNQKFWTFFFATSFPTSLDEETDMSLDEIIDENCATDMEWWKEFTKYYDGVLEKTDGYVDAPETVVCNLTAAQTLKIEFHPGDTVYYVNGKQIACTGGHYRIQIFPFMDLLEYSEKRKDIRVFFLLLPLTIVKKKDADHAAQTISKYLKDIFETPLCNQVAKSIVYGLTER